MALPCRILQLNFEHLGLAILDQNSARMGDCLATSDAAGMSSEILAAQRQWNTPLVEEHDVHLSQVELVKVINTCGEKTHSDLDLENNLK